METPQGRFRQRRGEINQRSDEMASNFIFFRLRGFSFDGRRNVNKWLTKKFLSRVNTTVGFPSWKNNENTGKRDANKNYMEMWFISHTIVCWKLFTRPMFEFRASLTLVTVTQSRNLHNNEVTFGAISVKNVVMRTAIEWEIDWNFMLMPLNHLWGIQNSVYANDDAKHSEIEMIVDLSWTREEFKMRKIVRPCEFVFLRAVHRRDFCTAKHSNDECYISWDCLCM